MGPKVPLFSFFLTTLLAFTSAQRLVTVSVDPTGSVCPAPATTVQIQPVVYSQYFQTAGEIININGGVVTINNVPTTIYSSFFTTVTNINSIQTATITVDQNGNTVDPNTRGTSTTTTSSGLVPRSTTSTTTTTSAGQPTSGASQPTSGATGPSTPTDPNQQVTTTLVR